jgi:hypothetical protein
MILACLNTRQERSVPNDANQSASQNNPSVEQQNDIPSPERPPFPGQPSQNGEIPSLSSEEVPENRGSTKKNTRKRQREGVVSSGMPISFDSLAHTQRCGNYLAQQGRMALEDAIRNRERSSEQETPRLEGRGSRSRTPRNSETRSSDGGGGGGGDDSEATSEIGGRNRRGGRRRANKEMEMMRDILQNYDERIKQSIEAQRTCYGCNWAEGPKVEQSDLTKVDEVFFKKYAQMDDDALSVLLEGVFNKKVRDPYRKRGIDIPDWPAPVIKEHYLFHVPDLDVIFTEVLRTFHMTFHEIRNSFFTETTVVKYTQDESETDPDTGEPVRYRHEEKHWAPNFKAIRCGIDVYKTLKDVAKLSSSEYAPERKRARLKNMNPSLVCPERIQFGVSGL